mgnify:CR=1 FL=1
MIVFPSRDAADRLSIAVFPSPARGAHHSAGKPWLSLQPELQPLPRERRPEPHGNDAGWVDGVDSQGCQTAMGEEDRLKQKHEEGGPDDISHANQERQNWRQADMTGRAESRYRQRKKRRCEEDTRHACHGDRRRRRFFLRTANTPSNNRHGEHAPPDGLVKREYAFSKMHD